MSELPADSAETTAFLTRAASGDTAAVEELLMRHRPAVRAFVAGQLDPRLAARVDPSDVVQDALLHAARRLDDYLRRRPMPFRLWLRKAAYERLLDLRRYHLGRERRSVRREVLLPDRTSLALARSLHAAGPSPSQQLQAREFTEAVARALADLPEPDREVLVLRHAEEMPFEAIACLLEIEPAAARKRFGRALIRLQKLLGDRGVTGHE